MSMPKWVLLATISLLILGCTASQPALAPAGENETPKPGGQLNIVQTVDQHTWDLSFRNTAGGQEYAYNSLMAFKTGPDIPYAEMVLLPELAERWEVSPDAKVFTFTIRKGVKFQDQPPVNGRELNAADVKWSYEYWSRTGQFKDNKKLPKAQLDFLFEGIQSVETPDRYTAVVRFNDAFVPFLNYAATFKNPIAPHEIYDQDGDLQTRIVGTGPFILDQANSLKDSKMVWTKNPNYWDEGKPYLDSVRWLILPEKATSDAAFKTKQVDLLSTIEFQEYQELIGGNPTAVVQKYVQPRGLHIYFGHVHGGGPLSDIRLRRAIASAIDRDEINKATAGGHGAWAIPGAAYGLFTDQETRQLEKYDPAETKRLLTEAGFPNGLTLDWPYKVPNDRQIVNELYQAQLKRVGINAPFRTMDQVTQRVLKYSGDYDLDEGGSLGQVVADPDSMLFGAYHSSSSLNWAQLRDPELDRLVVAQRREIDPTKRKELMKAAGKRIIDMQWAVETIYPPYWSVSHPYVRNFYSHFGNNNTGDVEKIWLNK